MRWRKFSDHHVLHVLFSDYFQRPEGLWITPYGRFCRPCQLWGNAVCQCSEDLVVYFTVPCRYIFRMAYAGCSASDCGCNALLCFPLLLLSVGFIYSQQTGSEAAKLGKWRFQEWPNSASVYPAVLVPVVFTGRPVPEQGVSAAARSLY